MTRSRASAKAAGVCPFCQSALPAARLKYCSDRCRSDYRNVNRRQPRAIRTAPERIREKLAPGPNGCLEYSGYRNAGGYGVVQLGGNRDSKTALAHRVIWAEANGDIPEGVVIRHRCDNPACVNLDHLEPGTQEQNMQDRDRRGRTLRGEQVAQAKLRDTQVVEIRQLCREGVPHRVIASQYSVSTTQVSYIRNYKSRASA